MSKAINNMHTLFHPWTHAWVSFNQFTFLGGVGIRDACLCTQLTIASEKVSTITAAEKETLISTNSYIWWVGFDRVSCKYIKEETKSIRKKYEAGDTFSFGNTKCVNHRQRWESYFYNYILYVTCYDRYLNSLIYLEFHLLCHRFNCLSAHCFSF